MNIYKMFFPKIYYDNGAADGGGGAAIIDPLEKIQSSEIITPIITDEEMKGLGFDSRETFKTFLEKHKEESVPPEEKLAKENLEKANFLKFAAESKDKEGNPLLKVEDYNQYETLKSKSDRDLVFQKYLEDFKTDNPDIKDEEELLEAATEEFNHEYKLKEGQSESARKKGEAKLAREAKELRNPVESKVISAQEQFKQNNDLRQTYPKFESFVDEAIKRNTPDKLAAVKIKNGDTEIAVEIELTKADREEIAKAFKTPKTFTLFTSGKPDEIKTAIDNKMQGWLFQNKKNEIIAKTFELGKGIGTVSGSTVGANNPFPLTRREAANVSGEETLEQSNQRLAEARRKAQQR